MPPEKRAQDDYDSPWKQAIRAYFQDFMGFYFPNAAAQIDWMAPHTFLDQELEQVVHDAELGKRLADRLVSVTLLAQAEVLVYIHLEIQGEYDADFPQRVFVYNYRIFDRFKRPVATLAILADDAPGWRPRRYGYTLFGSRHYLSFPHVKLLDYLPKLEELLQEDNPFALVTAAHLMTRNTRKNKRHRYEAKLKLVEILQEKGWEEQRMLDFLRLIDWLMKLPKSLNNQLWQDITTRRNPDMPYVSSFEEFLLEKGEEKGIKQGESTLLSLLLETRFGAMPAAIQQRIATASTDQIQNWAKRVLEARSLDDVFAG
jgi:hypothetical protein